MQEDYQQVLRTALTETNYQKLMRLDNPKVHRFVAESIHLCTPDSVFVCTDAAEDIEYIRRGAIESGEETALATDGHTVHFDGYHDQAREKKNTRYLVAPGVELGTNLHTVDREEGLAEVRDHLKGSMAGREMLVCFFCLGPTNSEFSVLGMQITDSFYVAHSNDSSASSGPWGTRRTFSGSFTRRADWPTE